MKRIDTFSNIFLRLATSFPSFFRMKSGSVWSFWSCQSPRLNASRQRFVRVPKVLCKRRWFFPRGQVVELFFLQTNGCKWWRFTFCVKKPTFKVSSPNHLLRDGFFLPKNCGGVSSLVDCHWDGVGMEPSAGFFLFGAYGMVIPPNLR